MDAPNPELESFRQQWREEVSARNKNRSNSITRVTSRPRSQDVRPDATPAHVVPQPLPSRLLSQTSASEEQPAENRTDPVNSTGFDHKVEAPRSALEYYEKAVHQEDQGKLGDSLKHYRQAYKVCASCWISRKTKSC